jgi:serine protease Do
MLAEAVLELVKPQPQPQPGRSLIIAICVFACSTLSAQQVFPDQGFVPSLGEVIQGPIIQGQVSSGAIVPGQVMLPGQIVKGQIVEGQVIENRVIPPAEPAPKAGSLNEQDNGDTSVEVATELVSLLKAGGVPTTLESLRHLEIQQRRVAGAAAKCTVSVEIGPAQGCGVIFTGSGYVLTAAHVAMRPNKKAIITLSNGRRIQATTLGMDRSVDAGLIKIDDGQNNGMPWPHASLGTSANLVCGMWCIATGHPGGFDRNRGPVTRIGRILDIREGAIVTDCALIGGDSGGPLFDISGKLIAVHSRIGNDVTDNLHVPIDYFGDSWTRMQKGVAWGYLPGFRPVLGVKGRESAEVARVETVHVGSPAEKAGILTGDIIIQFGDQQIKDFDALKRAVEDTMPGEHITVVVDREGERRRLKLEVGRAD